MKLTSGIAVGLAMTMTAATAQAEVHTLQEALAQSYSNNPNLQAARAQLRATDENVPAALAGWRPQVTFSGAYGYAAGNTRSLSTSVLGGQTVTNSPQGRREDFCPVHGNAAAVPGRAHDLQHQPRPQPGDVAARGR